jgi:hypothetical protein
VRELHDEAQRRDGFVERVLPIVLDGGISQWTEETIPSALFDDILAVVETLDRLPPADIDPDRRASAGIAVTLHPDAKQLWTDWFNENAQIAGQAHGLASGFARKLPAHVARFALILHALWHPDEVRGFSAPRPLLSAQRMADAIELGEFFRSHVGRFLPLLGEVQAPRSAGTATRVLGVLRREGATTEGRWVSRSTLLNKLRTVSAMALSATLAALKESARVECRVVPGPTKPTEEWRLDRSFEISDSDDSEDRERGLPQTSIPNSDNSDFLPYADGMRRYSESSEGGFADCDLDVVPAALRVTVANLLALPAVEREAYRQEVARAEPGDPDLEHDRQALAWAERIGSAHSGPWQE